MVSFGGTKKLENYFIHAKYCLFNFIKQNTAQMFARQQKIVIGNPRLYTHEKKVKFKL